MNGHEAAVKLLLEKVDVDTKKNYGWRPLSWVAGEGHETFVRLLLKRGKVDEDSKDEEYGRRPLSWAAGERSRGSRTLTSISNIRLH